MWPEGQGCPDQDAHCAYDEHQAKDYEEYPFESLRDRGLSWICGIVVNGHRLAGRVLVENTVVSRAIDGVLNMSFPGHVHGLIVIAVAVSS